MHKNRPQILCTVPVGQSLSDKVADHRIDMDIMPFITIRSFSDKTLEKAIRSLYQKHANIVFTSVNAVETVRAYKGEKEPNWNIFCIGQATKTSVSTYFDANLVAGTADNASELADVITKHGNVNEVIFFCGDIHRDELPKKLKKTGIEVREVIVYQTISNPQKISKHYDAVLFFSPSAVNSFFEVNIADSKTVFFAIGNTTASAISDKASNTVVVCNRPVKEELVDLAIRYFENKESNK